MENIQDAELNIIIHDLILLSSKFFALILVFVSPVYSLLFMFNGGYDLGYFDAIRTLWRCDYEWRKDIFDSKD